MNHDEEQTFYENPRWTGTIFPVADASTEARLRKADITKGMTIKWVDPDGRSRLFRVTDVSEPKRHGTVEFSLEPLED